MLQFQALGLNSILLNAVVKLGFKEPTPIQREAIPLVLQGNDIVGLAQTGTGKTAAFGLPLAHQLLSENIRPAPKTVRSLIMAPTRELVNQIAGNLRDFVRNTPLRVSTVVGGASMSVQIRELGRGSDILVATPGRLLDLIERKALFLDKVKFLVLDEADQMLDLGFIHSLRKIAKLVGTPRQTLLFSATMPNQIEELSRSYLTNPVRIEVSPRGRAADNVSQSVYFVAQTGKAELLKSCLTQRSNDLSLVFARTKHGAEKLMKYLVACGLPAASIHGNKSQSQRERALRSFRDGEIRVLVATDVAARGIDIPGVSHVYNFDLPEVPENYVHRIGRTARAGADGEAIAFCGGTEGRMLRDIERLMGLKIRVAGGEMSEDRGQESGRGGNGGRGRNSGGGGRGGYGGGNGGGRSGGDGKPRFAAHSGDKPSHAGAGASARADKPAANGRGGEVRNARPERDHAHGAARPAYHPRADHADGASQGRPGVRRRRAKKSVAA